MEFDQIRQLLEGLRLELGVLFEHGLSCGGAQEKALGQQTAQMHSCGMDEGARLLEALCAALARSRVDPHWNADQAAGYYAKLWRYIGFCLNHLEFLQAEANLNLPGQELA